MTNDKQQTAPDELLAKLEQPPALIETIKAIELARTQISLYGIEHPNSLAVLGELAGCVEQFVETYERATCIFAKNAVIINEHYFNTTPDSKQICQRIRARGAMAITFVGTPPVEQLREFILFLNAEPRDVRSSGGPSTYLRQRGVSRIVLTEAVYTTEDDSDEDHVAVADDSFDDDRVLASVLNWLSQQDKEEDNLPKLPITQVLSNPDSAARLIREAVTKLHAARRQDMSGEIAGEVVNDLKSLAGTHSEEWDKAAPQIRKAILKLPQEMRPTFGGFTLDDENDDNVHRRIENISDIENMVGQMMQKDLPKPNAFDDLFGARAYGPLSAWRRELQPVSIMTSTGTTLLTLMRWENSACEHSRIVKALAEMVLRAMDVNDLNCALLFAGGLIEEAVCDNESGWRKTNVRSALLGLEKDKLDLLISLALENGSAEAIRISAALVDLCPEIALGMIRMLDINSSEEFKQSIIRAIVKNGTSASAQLADLLRDGSPSGKVAALEILIGIGRAWALEEVASVIHGDDEALAIMAVEMLPNVRVPMVSEILMKAASHTVMGIRIAAVDALGKLGDAATLDFLDKIAKRRHLFGRSKFENIRQSALRAAQHIRDKQKKAA
ncbi:HEAT repeat domain-containing protein [bacterium]|nr:HEAT repeat domain-containing protein [bacterium]